MSTCFVECWRCDVCGHRWIKGDLWPDRCASSKCRVRGWNANEKDTQPDQEQVQHPATPEVVPVEASPLPVNPDMAALREICAGNISSVAAITTEPDRGPCDYREPVRDIGAIYGCSLHLGHRGPHKRGDKIGDLWD